MGSRARDGVGVACIACVAREAVRSRRGVGRVARRLRRARNLPRVRFDLCDEFDGGFGWIADEFMQRCSHALVEGGRVWLIDALRSPDIEERIARAGEPAGVIQLLDRHARDCAELAERLGVPHHVVPRRDIGPFTFVSIKQKRRWDEVALWWREARVLVCGDALGTADYFRARGDRLAVHPLLRPFPPRRVLEPLTPACVLCGHGRGVLDEADAALHEALRTARRRVLSSFVSAVRAGAQRGSRS